MSDSFNMAEIIQRIALFFPCFLFSLTFHEFSHAWTASKFGDNTAAWSGRLTLNPLAHIDPIGTILFPLINVATGVPLIGWAKPVPVDSRNFKRYRAAQFWVSAAGPLSNFLLGFLAAFFYVGFRAFVPATYEYKGALVMVAEGFLDMNFALGVFNLLPIPPLDGSQMLISFLPYNLTQKVYEFWGRFQFLLFILVFMGLFRFIFWPIPYMADGSVFVAAHVLYYAAHLFGLA